jgi:hypothetical protein
MTKRATRTMDGALKAKIALEALREAATVADRGATPRGAPDTGRCVEEAAEGPGGFVVVGRYYLAEPLPAAEPRLGRRTALTFPLLPPPQKN